MLNRHKERSFSVKVFSLLYGKGDEGKSRSFALLQRPQVGESEESYTMIEHGPGAVYRKQKCSGYDGFTRYSDRLSADHFLPVVYEACAARHG